MSQFNVDDILQINFDFAANGITGKMIQYFRVDAPAVVPDEYTMSNLANSVFDTVATQFQYWLHTQAAFTGVYIRNRTNPLIEGSSNQPQAVGIAAGINPPFVAMSIFQQRATTATRNGFKRFPFLGEARTSGNAIVAAQTNIDYLETIFGNSLTVFDIGTTFPDVELIPVIIPRIKDVITGQYLPNYSNPNGIQSAEVQKVTTQNTRKT